jgi:hypothetical protein
VIVLRSAHDASPADWVAAGIRGFAESVLSVVPAGFPAYLRIFHPMHGASWTALAESNGKRAHPAMQIGSIGGDELEGLGDLPPGVAAPLADVLGRQTTTPDRCYFAVWEGWGGLPADVAAAPTFALPNRTYHLLTGPVGAASELVFDDPSLHRQSASLWWPEDRAWLVATEIDLHSTYVGCSEAARAAVLAIPGVEALPVPPEMDITFAGDTLN